MLKLEITKTIEARRLNKRTGQTTSEPPVTIPFGAILSNVVENRDVMEFEYLSERYNCKAEVLRSASHALDGAPTSTSAPTSAASAPRPPETTFVWEKLSSGTIATARAKLPGGWLIAVGDHPSRSIAFLPDPAHTWDGETL
jgi:hypothetical protein